MISEHYCVERSSARSVGHTCTVRAVGFLTVPRWIQKRRQLAARRATSAHRTRAPPRAAAPARPSSRVEGPSRVSAVDTRPTARHADPNVRARSSTHRQRHPRFHRGASSRAPRVARTRGRTRRAGAHRASVNRDRDGKREMAGACLLGARGFAVGARDSPSDVTPASARPSPRPVGRPSPDPRPDFLTLRARSRPDDPLTSPPPPPPPAAPSSPSRWCCTSGSCGTSSFGSSPSW